MKDKQLFLKALKASNGIVSHASDEVNISRTSHHNWLKSDSDYAQAVKDITEDLVDLAETSLVRLIKEDYWPAVKKVLDTKGRKRGWDETNTDDENSNNIKGIELTTL